MQRMKAGDVASPDQLEMMAEEKRSARISVITNFAIFGAIVLGLRISEL